MNPPKVIDGNYISFIIATPRDVTATEAERVQPESKNAPSIRQLLPDFSGGLNPNCAAAIEQSAGSKVSEKSKCFGFVPADEASEYWATSLQQMPETEREKQAKVAWRIEMYHRALKQHCLIERAHCRRLRPLINHIGLCIRAFVRIESHCYQESISWIQAKKDIIRDAVRAYLANPRYLLLPTE